MGTRSRDAKEHKLWTLELDGEKDDRIRKGAVWIARTERGSAAIEAPPHAAHAPTSSPVSPPSHEAPDAVARDAAGHDATHPNAIALSLHGAFNPEASESTPITARILGARAAMAHPLAGGVRIGAALAFDQGTRQTYSSASLTMGRAGGFLAFGAPWTDDSIGISIEGGGAVASRAKLDHFEYDNNDDNGDGDFSPSPVAPRGTQFVGYTQGSLTAQWPRLDRIRRL